MNKLHWSQKLVKIYFIKFIRDLVSEISKGSTVERRIPNVENRTSNTELPKSEQKVGPKSSDFRQKKVFEI